MKYEDDFNAWSEKQAAALRERNHNELDWDNLAEEIGDMGRSLKREVHARLRRICQHLLKWQFQPTYRTRSWASTIRTQRREIDDVFQDNPSLRPYAATTLDRAYAAGRENAEDETGLLDLPRTCPWTIDQVLDRGFWP